MNKLSSNFSSVWLSCSASVPGQSPISPAERTHIMNYSPPPCLRILLDHLGIFYTSLIPLVIYLQILELENPLGIMSHLCNTDMWKRRNRGVRDMVEASLRGCSCGEPRRRCPEKPPTSRIPEQPSSPIIHSTGYHFPHSESPKLLLGRRRKDRDKDKKQESGSGHQCQP